MGGCELSDIRICNGCRLIKRRPSDHLSAVTGYIVFSMPQIDALCADGNEFSSHRLASSHNFPALGTPTQRLI